MNAVLKQVIFGTLLFACAAPIMAAPKNVSTTSSVTALNLMQHDIFRNLYHNPVSVQKKKPNKIKETIKKLKKVVNLSFHENLKFKISRVKSGPLKQEVTQMFKVAPGIQTHEGLIGESSKGYGIKFTYQYD